ncbi:carboxypeptidase-like regulatory domain-containing protein [Phaeodactylibacter luteus]|uniref:Carboxypeptidase-like regulatory domain-containing protein n=1 Tax=Phaeodactylibacter luteus TaxID=1564516 RepID=A0A5C6RUC2_9BACT|nr:carboxypeptidase-like regulatory domain-containing protein [Phaeodactylibacter luteus]TXB65575.1 carboxypeptidase-like regulatory domain-containing protein [Phaeodactylibacter luteus]
MKGITLIVLILQLMSLAISAQEHTFYGEIQDVDSKELIPYAHFQILPEGQSGFVADLNGTFSHRADEQKIEVMITAIGYEPKRAELTVGAPNIIGLHAASLSLSEVVVTYVDRERDLLQKVLDAIPENYPQQSERITGRVIEQLAADSLYQDLIYSADAIIEADKLTYSKPNKYSTVRILDGEVEFQKPGYSPFTTIIAGAHNVHRFDVVAAREAPLDDIFAEKYRFKLLDTLSYMGGALFKMEFETPGYYGALYIQDSTYALVRAEYTTKKEKLQSFVQNRYSSRLFRHFTIEYFKEDRFFRLSFINYRTGFSEKDVEPANCIYLNNFFYLNRHTPSTDLISFKDQVHYNDRLVQELSKGETAQLQGRGFQGVFKNISYNVGLGLLRYKPWSELSALYESGLDGQLRSGVNEVVLAFQVNYRLNNVWGIGYAGGASIGFTRKVNSHSLLMTRSQPITKNQRCLIGISAGANYFEADLETGEGLPFGDLLQNTTLQEEAVQVNESSQQINLITGLQLKYRVGARSYLALDSYLPFSMYNKLEVIAKQGEERVLLYGKNFRNPFSLGYYQFGLGLQLYF